VIDTATAVVSQPLPVVEAMIRDVSSWSSLFGEVEDVTRLARDRYLVQLRRGRRIRPAVVGVRRNSPDHRIAWRALSGPNWSGELHLVALTGRRTAVHLILDRTPRRQPRLPGPGAGLRRLLRGLVPGRSRNGRPPVSQAHRDLGRFRERVDALPRPVRPARMGPLPGARPVEDVLIIDGLRRRVPQLRASAPEHARPASVPEHARPAPAPERAGTPESL
jgi:hypothetical protein